MSLRLRSLLSLLALLCVATHLTSAQKTSTRSRSNVSPKHFEYLWYEAENMRGISADARHEPRVNPSWLSYTSAQSPGWGINGPGVSAEWSQGGESEWNSVGASADETKASLSQDIEVPRDGSYRVWVRYADYAGRAENFVARVEQGEKTLIRQEFGVRDVVDPHDEISMYWGWAFTWDTSPAVALKKGSARLFVEIERAAETHRQVDCVLLTDDLDYRPEGRRKPPFAAFRVLQEWGAKRSPLAPLTNSAAASDADIPALWRRPLVAGRDFQMPWNISETFWKLYDNPPATRPLYPFNAEPLSAFIEKYRGAKEVPIFASKLVVPVIYINELPRHLKEGSAFLRYLRETRAPFAVLINYGAANFSESEGRAAWKLLTGELKEQFVGWISGESIGHVFPDVMANLKLSPEMSRREMLDASGRVYTNALIKKWSGIFHVPAGAMWEKLIPAQSTSSTAYAHALGRWGVRMIGIETAAVQPSTAMRLAFTRGAARQYGGTFLFYQAPNFGDTATVFTNEKSFAGPGFFFHTHYGTTMGPSLSWYRKNYFLSYMAGASAIYLEQGWDQFFKPGPDEHPFQLNPLGRITDEFMRFAERHPQRGTPYTPIAFLLDPAHGWDMTDYPHWPLGVSPVNRGDRALRELFGAAYYPAPVNEGEFATADRQAFVNGIFGDIFDVLVADEGQQEAIDAYRALIVGGRVEWSPAWAARLRDYASKGGTVVINAAQVKGLPPELLGVRALGTTGEADDARCLGSGETPLDLSGQVFRYERVELRGAEVLMKTAGGDSLVTVNRVGRGRVVFCAVPDLLGLDERLTPAAAHLLAHLAQDATPVRVRGDIEYLLNRTPDAWVVTLINNRGVYKPQQGLAQVNRAEMAEVSLSLDGAGLESANEWTTDAPVSVTREKGRDSLRVSVPPGGIRIIELLPRK
ncbi:MAG: hypothetical protein WCD76_18640 [Pyrinomonadaceae bacterium]